MTDDPEAPNITSTHIITLTDTSCFLTDKTALNHVSNFVNISDLN